MIIDKPCNFSILMRNEISGLIAEGGQITYINAKSGIDRAELLGVSYEGEKMIAIACLKNPKESYRAHVFKSAQVPMQESYPYELGYIITRSGYEGKGLCQELLSMLYAKVSHLSMFATTRKPEMVHILKKFGFEEYGKRYNGDLGLMVYNKGFSG
jgi:predicted GNAT family N-acyltransferase